ncbi:MAG: polyprenyl diphosphate synthase [Candidatus Poseidoniaceae archaeon]|nr:polyprenyl diphosphate synthase [Candidatus Poseidoniaceae archaeon]|tara:strand:- start:247 stop:1146 length:900 start_codon:yes stop_codon:yes gene_type:complete
MVSPSGDGSQACRLIFGMRVEECASDEMKHHAFLEGSRVSMGISERMGDVLGLAVESKLMREIAEHPVSVKHLAIIMDGNRRFAWKSNVATGIGHRIGKEKLEKVLDWVLDINIPWLTVYALSTENLNRPQEELDVLFKLYVEGLHDIADDPRIHDNKVRVQIIGRRELLPKSVNDAIDYAESKTQDYDQFVFTVCLAYGSREEMIDAIRSIAKEHADGELPLESIDEQAVSDRLYTGDMPDPDLVIRTSGEERISNFLLWQMAYSELYFTDVFWPSFQKKDLLKAVRTFQDRRRRFGE